MIANHIKALLFVTILVAAFWEFLALSSQTPPSFDVVIAGGRIVDGTGAPGFLGDVGITDGRIVAMGRLDEANAAERINARGLVVAPGFIDMLGQSEFNILVDGRAASKIMQGITTEITGEGASIAPVNDRMVEAASASYRYFGVEQDFRTLAEYFDRVETRSLAAINIATFVGSGGVRDYVVGREDRPASLEELEAMKKLVAEAMEDGALGLSSSLQYVPNRFASTDELVELAKVAADYGGIYITHQRSEGNLIFESLDEVFAIAERAQIPTEVWHLKTAYKANWGKMPEVLEKFETARARGLDVSANQYPYDRASNALAACLPVWAALKHPLISINTDSAARAEDGPLSESKSHPRAWGTFPRILGKYVREEKLLTLEEAVRKMTSRPATRVRLQDRGILRPGMAADITVFDPETIRDVATFEEPNRYSVGVRHVLVNGRPVVEDGKITDERPGQVLRGPGYRSP